MNEMCVRAGRKDVVGSACRKTGVGCSSGVGRGEQLELDEDLDLTGVYLARDGGSVCARWKP